MGGGATPAQAMTILSVSTTQHPFKLYCIYPCVVYIIFGALLLYTTRADHTAALIIGTQRKVWQPRLAGYFAANGYLPEGVG